MTISNFSGPAAGSLFNGQAAASHFNGEPAGRRAALASALRIALLGGAASCLALPGAAFAQQAAADEAQPAAARAANADAPSGNEIVVTATKREQTLQSVPVAVSVTTGKTLEEAQIHDVSDLSTVVSSLKVDQHESSSQINFLIRGFGNGANNVGIEPSVGVFIDGVYRSRSAAQISDFPDVSRIEVLRGPQSTLFGKNASAGVISITTDEPKFKFGGKLEGTYGTYNAVVLKGTVTGPITPDFAVSLTAGYDHRNGYDHDLATGASINGRNREFVRGQALYQPDNQLKIRVIADFDRINELCCGVFNLVAGPTAPIITALGGQNNSTANIYANNTYSNFDSTNLIKNYGVSGQIDYDMGAIKLTSITAYRKSTSITNEDADFSSADLLRPFAQQLGIRTFTQELRLTSNLPGPINFLLGGFYFNEHVDQNNQLAFGNAFRPFADAQIRAATGNTQNVAALEGEFGAVQGNPNLYTGKFFAAGEGQNQTYGLTDNSASIFAQADFKVTDRLTLTGGINYTHDAKRFSAVVAPGNGVTTDVFSSIDLNVMRNALTNAGISQTIGGILHLPGGFASPQQIGAFAGANPAAFGQISAGAAAATAPLLGLKALQLNLPFLGVPNAVEPGKTNDGNVSYTARVAFDVDKVFKAYLDFSTGFKASSINLSRDSRPALADAAAIQAAGLTQTNQTYGSRFAGPENSTVYEAGLKANWGVASLNLAVFKEIIKGFQQNLFTGTGFYLANAGKESEFGIEAEGMIHPTHDMTLSSGLTYLNPKYDSFVLSAVGDLSGTKPAGIPSLTFNAAIDNNHRFGNGDRLILRADWHYESRTAMVEGLPGFSTSQATQIAEAQMFTRLVSEFDASATWSMHNGIDLMIWGRNITNQRHLITIFDSPAQAGSVSGYTNQPRTLGATARIKW